MSTASAAAAATAAASYGGASSSRRAGLESCGGRGGRGEKKSGSGRRGRRRGAAGEQRRWGDDDDENDFSVVAPPRVVVGSGSGRRSSSNRHEREQYFEGLEGDVVDPDVAFALAISVAERNSVLQVEGLSASVIAELTYESLAQLEDVRCVASATVVTTLPVCSFVRREGEEEASELSSVEKAQAAELRMCVICQDAYDHGDLQVRLPCLHMFHQGCVAEWLLNYSKVCPICKLDITKMAAEVT